MKRNEIIIPIILLICCIITSCSERSTNPSVVEELNDITSPPSNWIKVLVVNSSNDFFAGTINGLFRSTDKGSNWDLLTLPYSLFHDINEVKITSNDDVYAPSYSLNIVYLLRSTDNGNTWFVILETPGGSIKSIEEDQYGNIYYCGFGLLKSTDYGNEWQNLFSGGVGDVCIPNDSTIVIGVPGSFHGQILYSTNSGISWDSTHYGVTVLSFYQYNSLIFTGGSFGDEGGGGVHKSTDGGISWEFCGFGLNSVTSFVTNNKNQLLCGTDRGIYLTDDLGATWQNVLADSFVTTLMRDLQDFLYAGTNHGSFLRSTDNGMTWQN